MQSSAPVNFLSPINFKFQIFRSPNVNFFIQKLDIPGLSLPAINVNNPLIRVPYPGEHILYDELSVSFKVDEDLKNYLEIFNWIKGIGKQTYELYQQISSNPTFTGNGLTSDISIQVLTNKRNPNHEIVLKNCFPISLSPLSFDASAQNIDYLQASVKFRYTYYDINKIT
jgi:hypothetical protein